MRRLATGFTATALLLVACGDGGSKTGDTGNTGSDTSSDKATTVSESVSTPVPATTAPSSTAASTSTIAPTGFAARPFDVFVPSTYDAAAPMPLVIMLHGFGASGNFEELLLQLQPHAESRGFLYVHPDGTINSATGSLAWNGTDACCDNTQSVDDVGYLNYVIDEVSAQYNVDPARVYLFGHSNGGFMSYRMSCDSADRIAAIVSLAGATFADTTRCAPSEPVSVLQIHGTADSTIRYGGGQLFGPIYPGAETTVDTWATYNGCSTNLEDLGRAHLIGSLGDNETILQDYTGCPDDGAVELWTIEGGPHTPSLLVAFNTAVIDWLYAHPKA